MTVTVLAPYPVQRFYDNNGNPLFQGKLFTYAAGTSTPITTYVDSAGITQNANPIILNARGECNLWLLPNTGYKFVLQDATESLNNGADDARKTMQEQNALAKEKKLKKPDE